VNTKYPFNVVIYRDNEARPIVKTVQTIGVAVTVATEESRKRFVREVEVTVTLGTYKDGRDIS
jgi:hypothetical protein